MLSLVSLNVERSKHLDTVLPFLVARAADVVCVQELCERDFEAFEKAAGPLIAYAPMNRRLDEGAPIMGLGIFSRLPVSKEVKYYRGVPGDLPDFDISTPARKHETEHAMVVIGDFDKEGVLYRIATTHFTWTPDGQPDDLQRLDLKNMLPIMDAAGEFVFCGDFNAPRGGEIFSILSSLWKDNIPKQYKTSIDIEKHWAGKLRPEELARNMVDGLFTTPRYIASDVELIPGVSDHMAIVATIAKHD